MKVGDKVKIKSGAQGSTGFVFNIESYNRKVKCIKGKSVQLEGDDDIWFWIKDIILIEESTQTDSIVESVISQYRERSEVGIKKYNNTMDRKDLSNLDWLTHLQQELMDATLYIEKFKNELK